MRRVVIHIGPHRTGTTSFQRFLADHREDVLADAGWRYPVGLVWDSSHTELTLASLAPARLAEMKALTDAVIEKLDRGLPATLDPEWRSRAADELARHADHDCVYSVEGLSWLRSTGEMERLVALFPDAEVDVVVVRRDPEAFLASYRWMATFTAGAFSDDPDSIWYVEPDSWLADLDERIDAWRSVLGDGHVHVVDYEHCMETDGSVLPALCEVLGIDRSIGVAVADEYRANPRPS